MWWGLLILFATLLGVPNWGFDYWQVDNSLIGSVVEFRGKFSCDGNCFTVCLQEIWIFLTGWWPWIFTSKSMTTGLLGDLWRSRCSTCISIFEKPSESCESQGFRRLRTLTSIFGFLQAAKILANLIVLGSGVLLRAVSQAYRQAIQSMYCIPSTIRNTIALSRIKQFAHNFRPVKIRS